LNKLVKNQNNLTPVIISIIWCLFTIFQFFTTVPELDQNNRHEGSSMFILGLIMLSIIVFFLTLFWIIISNLISKMSFYVDTQYSLMIIIIFFIVIIIN